jgi:hypothetical protein
MVGMVRYCSVRNSKLNYAMICSKNRLDSSYPPVYDRSFHIIQGELSKLSTLCLWIGDQLDGQITYRARARARAPAAPAMPKATPLVGAGAPPVDFAGEAEAEADVEPEPEPEEAAEEEPEEAAEEEPDEVFCAAFVTDGAPEVAVEAVSEATSCVVVAMPRICASKFEEAQALTLLGSSLYQAG